MVPNSQSAPSNNGRSARMVPPKSFMRLGSSGGLLFLGEQFAEYRIDVAAVADLAHGHRRAGFADRGIGLPQVGVAADEAGREVLGIAADFQVGVGTGRPAGCCRSAAPRSCRCRRRCCRRPTPARRRCSTCRGCSARPRCPAFPPAPWTRRCRRFPGVEECILVDFLRLMRVANEHHVHILVAALEENIEQHVEPLGEVLHVLGHRAGHVHQAEHHRLCHRLWLRVNIR